MKTSIGGDRLGSGNKQNVHLKNFGRSTHDLSYIWRSTMSSGTLVPFLNELALPGDSFDINLNCEMLTLPTVGPLFGSYKVQLDVFSCPLRLYNRELHMNKLGIGMDMAKIKLPQLVIKAQDDSTYEDYDNYQIDPSSIFSYLGIRGIGRVEEGLEGEREFLGVPFLAYWDVYKQYYANKQEEEGVVIHAGPEGNTAWNAVEAFRTSGGINILDNTTTALSLGGTTVVYANGAGTPDVTQILLNDFTNNVMGEPMHEQFESYEKSYNSDTNRWTITFITFIGTAGDIIWNIEGDDVINGIIEPDGKPQLNRFPLSNIDDMRETILTSSTNGVPFKIDENRPSPYGLPFSKSEIDEDSFIYAKQFTQEGLAIKTYQSDLFNNWISTEWIDGDNGINAVTAVSTVDGNFTIDALNIANKVYNMLNRIAISGGTYDDWLQAVYTHDRTRSVESPVYMGSLIKQLSFQEVVSTGYSKPHNEPNDPSQVFGGDPLGTLAGRGQMTSKNKGGKIKIKVDEPSIIMGLVSLTPIIDYSQGNKWHMNLKTMDDLHKPSLDAIGYQDLITDGMAWFDTTIDPSNKITFKSAGKQPAWINYMTNVNVVRGDFAKVNNSMFMTLNRRYENGDNGISDLTTYIDPSKFNHIFAETRLDAQNFWCQIGCNITARRKMSAKVIPNL